MLAGEYHMVHAGGLPQSMAATETTPPERIATLSHREQSAPLHGAFHAGTVLPALHCAVRPWRLAVGRRNTDREPAYHLCGVRGLAGRRYGVALRAKADGATAGDRPLCLPNGTADVRNFGSVVRYLLASYIPLHARHPTDVRQEGVVKSPFGAVRKPYGLYESKCKEALRAVLEVTYIKL